MNETIIITDSVVAVSGTNINTVASAKIGFCQAG